MFVALTACHHVTGRAGLLLNLAENHFAGPVPSALRYSARTSASSPPSTLSCKKALFVANGKPM